MIQIDKTMPQNCYDCPCTNDGFYRCLLADKQLEDDCEDSRPTWCPLHEVTDTDTISRQAVLDAIFSEPLYESGMKKRDSDIIVPAIYEKIKALPPSPSRPHWIPCSERLPEEHKSVLCCTYGGTHFIGYIKEAKQGEYMAVSGDSDYKTVYEIVAWMPLPKPYEV